MQGSTGNLGFRAFHSGRGINHQCLKLAVRPKGANHLVEEGSTRIIVDRSDLPVVKSVMPGIVGGADQNFDVPKGLAIDRPWRKPKSFFEVSGLIRGRG